MMANSFEQKPQKLSADFPRDIHKYIQYNLFYNTKVVFENKQFDTCQVTQGSKFQMMHMQTDLVTHYLSAHRNCQI